MNKHLLMGSALLVAISAYPQAGKLSKPSGMLKEDRTERVFTESAVHVSTPGTGPNKNIKPQTGNVNAKVAAIATRFTGSINAFGVIYSAQKVLDYNAGVNAVSFVHRKSPTYVAGSNSNSGSIVAMISTNAGSTWDSTCFWTNGTNLARYPQGAIYNPLGNTNLANAYIVGSGPVTAGAWDGMWVASKNLATMNNMPGSDQQFFSNVAPFGGLSGKVDFPSYQMRTVDGGLVRALGKRQNDENNLTAGPNGRGWRGASMLKGQFNAGSFVWSVDSFLPPAIIDASGDKICYELPYQAWSENGQIGYLVFIGARASETISPTQVSAKGGLQPMVYKTTNSGASWALLPANDFTTPQFLGLTDRLFSVNSNTNMVLPWFNPGEDIDVTVDFNGQLHIATTIISHSSNHVDSLFYRPVFTAEQYNWGFSGPFDYPIIYDFYTTPTGWNYHMVDSMGTMGPSGQSGQPGYNTNVWADGSGGKIEIAARIQMSRSTDGKQVFYSWTESDSAIIGTKWNIGPNIYTRGFDVTIDKVTPKYNLTNTITPLALQGGAFFHYMGQEVIASGANHEIPFTISTNGAYDGGLAMDHYYLKGANVPTNAFTINPLRPTSVASLAGNVSAKDVNVYPNPASGSAVLTVQLQDATSFNVLVYNTVGQLIQTIPVNGQIGSNEISMDLSNLNKGVYFCNVNADGVTITKKLIVQ